MAPLASFFKRFHQGMKVAGDHLDLCLEGVLQLRLVSERLDGWTVGDGKLVCQRVQVVPTYGDIW